MTKKDKSVKKSPNLRFPGFQNSWKILKLRDISKRVNEKNTNNYLDLVFSNSAVQGIVLQNDYFEKSIANKNNLQGYYIVKPLDFVYNPRISANAEVGAMNINNTFKTGLVSPLYTVFRINSTKVLHQFLEIYFKSKHWHHHMREIANYGARDDRMNIKNDDFYDMDLQIPQIDEQIKITSFLSKIILKIETQKKTIENLESLKSSLLNKIFKRKNEFYKNKNWEERQLAQISHEHQDKNKKNLHNEVFSVAKNKGVINQIEHLGRSFSASDISNYKLIYPGDLVYTKSPTSDFPFGIIKQNRTNRIGVVSPLYCVFTPQSFALGYLIHEYFESAVNTFNYLNPLVQKGAKNTMNINNDTFLNGAELFLPIGEREQGKLYKLFSSINQKIEIELRILEKLNQQKKYFLQNLFI